MDSPQLGHSSACSSVTVAPQCEHLRALLAVIRSVDSVCMIGLPWVVFEFCWVNLEPTPGLSHSKRWLKQVEPGVAKSGATPVTQYARSSWRCPWLLMVAVRRALRAGLGEISS